MSRFIAAFSIIPIGTGNTSLSKYIAVALKALGEKGIKFELTPMATIIEADSLDEIFNAIKICHNALIKMGVKRIVININIDDRLDRPERKAKNKIESVLKKIQR